MIYYIGGSPCSGKSTVAEALAARYDLSYFKADDHLDEFTTMGAAAVLPVCTRIQCMSPDENWMRLPQIQCQEELAYYAEIAPFVAEKLHQLPKNRVISEGTAFLPYLMQIQGISFHRYIAIVPSAEFQISRYRQRPWVPHVLRGCTDPESAFLNWMERDVLFGKDVRQQCITAGYTCLITDGSVSPEERMTQVAAHFRLNNPVCQEHI